MKLGRLAGLGLLVTILGSRPAFGCKCELSLSACSETAYSSLVFTGTVESITPPFLMRWNPVPQEQIDHINRAHEQYLAKRTPAAFAALKEAVHTAFPQLGEDQQRRLANSASPKALVQLLSSVLEGTRRIRFRVRTIFRQDDDDKKDKKSDDDDDTAKTETIDVMTPFGDCGIDFQAGETYLVYASEDEETNILETSICNRTRRLTDAGSDLAYLYFYKDRKNPGGRVQGFTTFDRLYQLQPHGAEEIPSPAAGLTIELKSDSLRRYTASNGLGLFTFDGLAPGDYQVTAYPANFPEAAKVLDGPRRIHLDERGCATQVLTIPKEAR
ncbi:MAG TPA: carboxypeptidase-like regulatory domain-containing protein [Bryobacteraceae bacterium]|nr:carboxypeptidase-like regulatory domain-containing protein [Bryobacteraceae bacterium]